MILSENKFEIDVEFTMKSKETVSQGFGIFLTNKLPTPDFIKVLFWFFHIKRKGCKNIV